MSLNRKYALITGSSRGIGTIALKLAEHGVKVAIHYYKNEEAANDTLLQVQQRGADGLIVQADVSQPQDINCMFSQVQDKFGKLDIFVSCARPDIPTFYHSPMEMTLEHWHAALDSQAQAFLLGTQKAAELISASHCRRAVESQVMLQIEEVVLSKKFHIAISVTDLDASIDDYSQRLGCSPCVMVPNEYALWRTEALNFSIRATEGEGEKLRHLGWEDESADAFSQDIDVNGILWERFAANHQQQEIESVWSGKAVRLKRSATAPSASSPTQPTSYD